LSFSDVQGWSETINGAFLIADGTYGGNAMYSGFDYKNYDTYHNKYTTYGFGLSKGSPIGFTINKGYSWYFLKF